MDKQDQEAHPPHLYPPYKSTILRSPTKPLMLVKELLKDVSLPVFGESVIGKFDNDLTKNARKNGEPIGERIKVSGVVMDEYGKPIPNVLIEIWQANSAGRYIHKDEIHDAPLDPNFLGGGRILTWIHHHASIVSPTVGRDLRTSTSH